MSDQYQVTINKYTETGPPDGMLMFAITSSVLSMRVDELHEIAQKLAALYPVPVVKRQHRRRSAKEVTP